jgi:predicted DNA-binding protein YlxM (UPF0122 family)
MSVKILKEETLLHKEAFEFYYSLGSDRSITQVAHKFNVTRSAIAKWSKSFDWQDRIKIRDIEISKKLQQKTDTTIISTKANYRKIIQASIATYVDALKNKGITVRTIRDLVDLMKLDLELLGETPQEEIKIIIEDAVYPE